VPLIGRLISPHGLLRQLPRCAPSQGRFRALLDLAGCNLGDHDGAADRIGWPLLALRHARHLSDNGAALPNP
jgi:hypothetical protein